METGDFDDTINLSIRSNEKVEEIETYLLEPPFKSDQSIILPDAIKEK
jgi:hypothetical protein